jgi:hypothetical protein
MARTLRMALLLAASLLHGACSAEEQAGNSSAASEANIVTEAANTGAPRRAFDARTEPVMTQERIVISSQWGRVTAELADNDATRALVRMLPITLEMSDHLRQEKTGNLPSPLPEVQRQSGFSAGTLGLWGNDDFVIYYRAGRVPSPGIIILGRVTGDVSIFDRPGPVTVRIERAD